MDDNISLLRDVLQSAGADFVALDVEWEVIMENGRFAGGAQQPVALLQLCYDQVCVLIRLSALQSIPDSLSSFLQDRSIKKVGNNIKPDIDKVLLLFLV